MSNQDTKSKEIELPKTFETTKGVDLTATEKKALSREKIMAWYESKKFEKLKGLQASLMTATYSERMELKKIIAENTKNELAKHEEIIAEERNKRAENFAEEIIGVYAGVGNIDSVIRKFKHQQLEEDKFFGYLKTYVGKEEKRDFLAKLKGHKEMKGVIDQLAQENPAALNELEEIVNKGDFKEFVNKIHKAIGGMVPKAAIEAMIAQVTLGEENLTFKTGISGVDAILGWWDKARNIGGHTVIKKAASDLGIEFLTVMQLSTKTLAEIIEMDNTLQTNKHLIEGKAERSLIDADRIKFIEEISIIRTKFEEKMKKEDFQKKFDEAMHKYIGGHKDLDDEDKIKILNSVKIEDLRMIQIFGILYGGPEEGVSWALKLASRIPTILRAHREVFGDQRFIKSTQSAYNKTLIKEWAVGGFLQDARKWGMGGILKDMDAIENMILSGEKFQTNEFDKLFKRADKFKDVDEMFKKGFLNEEMLEHDNIVKRYQGMVQDATKIMTKEAEKIIDAGKAVELVRAGSGQKFLSNNLNDLPYISDANLKALFGDVKIDKNAIKGSDLIEAYTKRIVDIQGMQEVSRARFAVLAETIDQKVSKPFNKALSTRMDIAKGLKGHKDTQQAIKRIEDMVRPTPVRYYARTFGLPAIILGGHTLQLVSGKSKGREVMWDLGEAAGGFMPFLGTALDIRCAIKGKTLSGRNLKRSERFMYAGYAAIGLVADAATFIGGIGLGLRATIGGARSGRRAIQVAQGVDTANSLRKIAYTDNLPWFQRKIAGSVSWFKHANRAEAATETMYAARAMEQANIMSSLNKYGKLDDVADVSAALKVADPSDVYNLQRLQRFYEASGGINYMNVMKTAGREIRVPGGLGGRLWYSTLSSFKKIKAKLLSIGIPADTIRTYENTFGAVKAAEADKIRALDNLQALYKARYAEQLKYADDFKVAYDLGAASKVANEKRYAELLKKSQESAKKTVSLSENSKHLKGQYTKLQESFDNMQRMSPDELAKLGKKVTQEEVDAAKKLYQKTEADWTKAAQESRDLHTQKSALGRNISSSNPAWKNQIDNADKKLKEVNNAILTAESKVKSAEGALHSANTTRSLLQAEMIRKANDVARISDKFSMVTRSLQTGGLVVGGIWAVTMGSYGPAEQYQAAKEYVPKVAGVAGKVGYELLIEDHSGKPPIDVLVAKHVESARRRKTLGAELEIEKSKGVNPAAFLATKWPDEAAQELAKRSGYFDEVQKILAEGKVKIEEKVEESTTALSEVATGDVAGRVKEKVDS